MPNMMDMHIIYVGRDTRFSQALTRTAKDQKLPYELLSPEKISANSTPQDRLIIVDAASTLAKNSQKLGPLKTDSTWLVLALDPAQAPGSDHRHTGFHH